MKLLVIGSGGREHAIAWRLAQSQRVQKVFVAPGNGGTAQAPHLENVALSTPDALMDFVRQQKVAFTVVGPEAPLAAGIVDAFRAAGLKIFGPTRQAAQLESSKSFAKDFMLRHQIATADHRTFRETHAAKDWIRTQKPPIVIKADGLAAGKGVVVAQSQDEALAAVDHMLGADGTFGAAGARIVVEEFLPGEEASFIVMSDGHHVLPLATSQDHKRLLDGDQGPNTGGMGAVSPAAIISPALHNRIMREIILPTIQGMAHDGIPYTGFLYAGLMIGPGPDATRSLKVLEFNVRMGDPETQPILMRMKSDFVDCLEHALEGRLDLAEVDWDRRAALGVVLAAAGYPTNPRTGDAITSLAPDDASHMTFHAGTHVASGQLQTSGGRVLCVTALADSVRRAQESAYEAVGQTLFAGRQYRHDIGERAILNAKRHD